VIFAGASDWWALSTFNFVLRRPSRSAVDDQRGWSLENIIDMEVRMTVYTRGQCGRSIENTHRVEILYHSVH